MKVDKTILLLSKDETYLVKELTKDFHTKSGVIKERDLVKAKISDTIKTHLGKKFVVVKPNITDILKKGIKRAPQVMLPKDIALIIAYTGVSSGSLVVDAGCGSGYTAIFLANYVKPGKVITYERDPRFIKIAKENIKLSQLSNFIKLKQKDITKGIDEKDIDLITLDVQNPEKVVKQAYKALKPGGWLAVYSPTIEEVIAVTKKIRELNFSYIKTVENIVREWQTERTTRPKTMGIMHTGFLTFARKVN